MDPFNPNQQFMNSQLKYFSYIAVTDVVDVGLDRHLKQESAIIENTFPNA
jgi:hypothetical protein